MDLVQIRQESIAKLRAWDLSVDENLPLLDPVEEVRDAGAVVDRLFIFHCLAAYFYGFSRHRACKWLEREVPPLSILDSEWDFLLEKTDAQLSITDHVEAMWVLAWCISVFDKLIFTVRCARDFVHRFPDLRTDESGEVFRARSTMRDTEEIVRACDTARCIHLAIANASNKSKDDLTSTFPSSIFGQVVVGRRHALEWVLYGGRWDEVSLDT